MSYFQFNNKQYQYIDHSSNQTRVNERRVELPLGFEFLEKHKGKQILEVGNVCNHYKPRKYYSHDVLDLFEKVPWLDIMNEDILTWNPTKKYDAILSISTLEHTDDPVLAVRRILDMAPNVFITIPTGYNKVIDVIDSFPGIKMDFMHRTTQDNDWEQCDAETAKLIKYNEPFPFANALIIIQK